jgi:formate hydrogenlyase subunit 6/NADH:ubiquinone oxidoreductase subunit I
MTRSDEPLACELCGRLKPLTFHHLIPRHVHRKRRYRRRYALAEMRCRGLYLCKLCHDGIHDLIPDEKELAAHFNTRELLLTHEALRRHIDWVRRQK